MVENPVPAYLKTCCNVVRPQQADGWYSDIHRSSGAANGGANQKRFAGERQLMASCE
jgi:hypothetical protein